MAKRSASSSRWLSEHESDPYVARARAEGYRGRAAYKLEELDQKDGLLRPGQCIVDLGAAPGGWTQYALRRLKGQATVVAIDILPMEPIAGAHLIEADFREESAVQALDQALDGRPVDLVLSDMAPNLSGVKSADQASATALVELAEDFAITHLRPGGDFVSKAFQGEGFDELVARLRRCFDRVTLRKPLASRSRSREIYLVARGMQGE